MYRLFWLALGAFAIGTEGFMIAGLLPEIAGDVRVDVPTAGQLVTVFALTYALSAPVLATALGNFARKQVLVFALAGFAVANLFAALSHSFVQLMGARVLLALCAATYMPAANAVAVTLVPPAKRGTAISIVTGGITVAVALGAPIGTQIGALGNWRVTFMMVALVAAIGVAGLLFGLPRALPFHRISLAERIAVLARPDILATLGTLTAALAGAFTLYVYLAPLMRSVTDLGTAGLTAALFLFGVAAAFGNALGGRAADRFGSIRMMRGLLVGLVILFLVIAVSARMLPASIEGPAILAEIAVWGAMGWAFYPAQASRMVLLAPDAAVVALSLNASALYFGIALGGGLGALALTFASPADLGLVGALCCLAALGLLSLSLRLAERRSRGLAVQPAE
jgi:predicted MFS family arabinose efflux permease